MVNRITNTPVDVNLYNARAITVNHAVTKNCVRQADGTLWCLAADYACEVNLYRSTDNGFSWSIVFEGIQSQLDMREQAGFNADGFFGYLIIDERYNNLDVYMGEWENVGGDGSLERKRWNLADLTETVSNTTILSTTDDPNQGGSFDICHNGEEVFITWIKGTGDLYVTKVSPRSSAVGSDTVLAAPGGHYGFLSTCCDKNGKVHIASTYLDGSDRKLMYARYDSTVPDFDGTATVEDLGASPAIAKDVAIARDGTDTICIAYYDQGDDEVRYVLSDDGGNTWDTPETLTRTASHGGYTDSITSDAAGRTNIIGGSQGGFLITYCEDNADGTPRCYIRELTTSDGLAYTLGDEKEVATAAPWTTESVVGVQFFHPTDVKLLDITDPGLVRIAFTVGEGDSTTMADTLPITIGQELLFESAYPSSLASETGSHTLDTADSSSLRVLVDIHGGPDDNIDYYSAGFTGAHTERFEAAFKKIGTSLRLLKYEPQSDNFLADRSAYGSPAESTALCVFSPNSYSFPSPAVDSTGIDSWVERDVRRLYLPPDSHLARTFVVNASGYLKRTVWTCEYDGNEYEISQIVPRFLSNQICYYEANAYVIGPSRDPWSRTILPSET